ncbi:carboxylesterase/lipase family protein [Salipiger sp.]|uniref:carboxylesterase/lipase family protein n=1 Tax=Salipiger sp. TaxID=2078585 RepID=UPI003A97815E
MSSGQSGRTAGLPVSERTISSETCTVETVHGRVRGAHADGTRIFRGIRYGESTAGANRFRPPLPPECWAGIRDALHWGPSAPQVPVSPAADPAMGWYSDIREVSEDCLFLNVFTPGCDGGGRPVMVWLHGGGWMNYACTARGLGGGGLALAQDVVVVSVNHRLGAFGYLDLGQDDPDFADAGNVGLLDLVAALNWVRDNIAMFGGDPRNVTIFGQSGGGAKVAALLALPAATGLYHKAIIQSSSGGLRIAGKVEAAHNARVLARTLGLPAPEGRALQAVPVDRLLDALAIHPGVFLPVVDGRHFHRDPFDPDAPGPGAEVPLIVGCTETEITLHLRSDLRNFHLGMPEVRDRLKRFLSAEDPDMDRILDAYRDLHPRASASDLLIAIGTDQLFKRNTYRMGALHGSKSRAPTHAYLFAQYSPVMNGYLRAPHCCDVPFILGTTDAAAGLVGSGAEVSAVSTMMMATWAAFARTGSPANDHLPEWRPYSDADRPVMVLNADPELRPDPGREARATLDALPCYEYHTSRLLLTR